MLSTHDLHYRIHNRTIIDDVNLKVKAGEVLALIGPNGAGKTTLLKLLSGELTPTSGTIKLHEKPMHSYPRKELARQRAVMSQRALINFDFTVQEIVMQGRHPHIGLGETDTDRQIVLESLARTETTTLQDRFYPTLSGGEQARVTFARILAQTTPLLLLDEPTSALDLRHQQLVMQIAYELAMQGKAVIVIVHDLNLAAGYAQRIAVLQEGQLAALGTPHEVLTQENIQQVFNLATLIIPHPQADCPLIVPLPLNGEPSSIHLSE